MEGSDFDSELYSYGEESEDLDNPVENIVLPYQGEDWEFANDNQQPLRYFESVDIDRGDQIPFSLRELASFYYNPLLERCELYADQFIESSNNISMEFERLLKVFEKSTEAVTKHGIDVEEKNKAVQQLCQKVFDTKTEQIKAEGYCQDQYKVSTVHRYNLCSYNESAAAELKIVIADYQRLSVEDGSLALYTRTLSQLQCQQYLCDASTNVRYHTDKMKVNTSTVKSSLLVKLVDESVDVIRQCINTMFKFVRKNDDYDDSFSKCLKNWIKNLVCQLYELARDGGYQTLASEEQFILNHVIRSPPSTQSWAAQLVQISSLSPAIDSHDHKHFIDHIIYLLLLTLRAPKGRQQFLRESKSLNKFKGMSDDGSDWILVEETSDYLKGGGSQWHVLPKESDMVSLYQQVPFEKLLSQVVGLQQDNDGKYLFTENECNSSKLLYVIACCDVICDILGEGLATLGTPKYKQLVRRIGQSLRNIVILVAEYWKFYATKVEHSPQPHSITRLQTEFDEFVKRCVERLLAVSQLGVYQFLADLPFKDVSRKAAETIYVLMNVPAGSRAEVDHLVTMRYTQQEWLDFVQDSDTKLAFEEHLSSMPENEIVYLLATFSNLACSQPGSENHLVNIIATDLYTISFVCSSTRDICCKMGRELLCSLAAVHPFVISTILQHVNVNAEYLSMQAYYAISDLPFHLWQPSKDDLDLLRLWVLNDAMPTVYRKLVPTIITGLNFGKKDNGLLFLPHNLHCDIATLLLEICRLRELGTSENGVLMKGIDKVSRIAYSVRTSLSMEFRSQNWMWDVLLRLKLNRSHLKCSESRDYLDVLAPMLDFNADVLLSKLVAEKLPEACYIAIMMTNIGHSLNVFLQHGISVFKVLAESAHKNAAVYCLATIVEMFIKGGIDLSINSSFVTAVRTCLHSEQHVLSHIASKIVEHDLSIPDHMNVLMGLIVESMKHPRSDVVLSYWLKLILQITEWWQDDAFKIFLDFLLKCAFNSTPECSFAVQELIYVKHQELMQSHNEKPLPKQQSRSVISSLLTYIGGEIPVVSFLQTLTTNFSYLSYYILLAEESCENEINLWSSMVTLMASNSVQSSFKRAVSSLKLGYKLHISQLTIYRWAHLLLLTAEDNVILPAICQKFFQRLIYIDINTGSSAGLKFFTSHPEIELLKKLKSKFSSLSTDLVPRSHFYVKNKMPDIYRAFELWLDEERLYDSHLYLPSLPSHYKPELLASVRTQSQILWSQFIDFQIIQEEMEKAMKFSANIFSEKCPNHSFFAARKTNGMRISDILKQFEAPTTLNLRSSADMSFPILINQLVSLSPEVLYEGIKSDVKSLLSHAQYFTGTAAKLNSLNANYLELLPDLYNNEEQRRLVKIQCQSAFSPTHSCAGPAQVQLQFLEKTLNDVASEHLKQNRAKYRSSVTSISDEAASEDFGFSAIHLVSTVQALTQKLMSVVQQLDEKETLMEFGANLFFELANLNSDERWLYPPTRHLLLTSIDLLGQTFIFGQPHQAVPLLEQMLKRPEMAAVLSSHFSPGSSCQRLRGGSSLHSEFDTAMFAQMYGRIVSASLNTKNFDILFVLITKFDIEGWCSEYNPPNSERLSLLESIATGLKYQCVQVPSPKKNNAVITKSMSMQVSSSAVLDVFITHLIFLLQHSADAVFFEAIRLLLNASKEQKLDVKVWAALVNLDMLSGGTGSHSNFVQISYTCVDMCIKHLAVFFSDERKNLRSSLCSKWEQYVPSLSKLMCNLIMFEIDFNAKMESTHDLQSISNHGLVNDRILPLFSPWISVMRFDGEENAGLPWTKEQQVIIAPIIEAMTSLVNEICAMNTWDIPQCVSCLWVFYLENTLTGIKEVAPEYIVSCYQSINGELPWEGFIPNLTDLDKIVQLCHSNQDCILHYLSHIFPKINWSNIISMCKVQNNGLISWVDHTGELLSYFLQILLFLCSDEARLRTYNDLESLLSASHVFPWHLVGFEEFELLANITADQYDAICSVAIPCNPRLQSSRYAVIRLLQTASGIPLLQDGGYDNLFWKDVDNNQMLVQTMWMKRKTFVRCIGNLIRNTLKALPQKDSAVLELVTTTITRQLLESILLIVQYDNSVTEIVLMNLYSEFWKCISRFHVTLQDTVTTVVLKFLDNLVQLLHPDHDISKSSCYVHLVLVCNLDSSFHVAVDPKVLSAVSEHSFNVAIDQAHHSAVNPSDNETSPAGLDLTLWTSLRHILLEHGRLPQAAFLEACMSGDCVLSLLAVSQNLLDSTESRVTLEKISLEGLVHILVEWIPQLSPKPDNEEKVLIFVGFLLKICCQVEHKGRLHPDENANLEFIAEKLMILIPTFEKWTVDRVKSGILGSLGIGRASLLTVGFRISIRNIICSVFSILCRLQPDNAELLKRSEMYINGLKNLPALNNAYGKERENIELLLSIVLGNSEHCHVRNALITKLFSIYFTKQCHLLSLLQ